MTALPLVLPTAVVVVIAVGILSTLIHPRRTTMDQHFFEYAVRIHPIGGPEQIVEYGRDFPSADARRRDEAGQHGDDRVHLLTRQAFHTEWRVSPTVPPVPPDPDGGICDPTPAAAKAVVDVTVGEAL